MAENLGMALVKLFGREMVNRAGLQDLAIVAEAGEPGVGNVARPYSGNWHQWI